MNNKQIMDGLKAIKQVCKDSVACEGCKLECYCEHRRAYGSPHLFPKFNNELVLVKDVRGKLLLIDFDELFNELNRICSATMYCNECVIRGV